MPPAIEHRSRNMLRNKKSAYGHMQLYAARNLICQSNVRDDAFYQKDLFEEFEDVMTESALCPEAGKRTFKGDGSRCFSRMFEVREGFVLRIADGETAGGKRLW
ncbi:MAG: hypothetical protein ACLSUW_07275 [Akkermansia sp.]